MTGLITFFVCLIAIFLIIIIHESGHFFAGIIFGIPLRQIKICLLTIPQCVAIKDGEDWLKPKDRERFVLKSREFITTRLGSIFFVAGGFIFQTIIFSLVFIGSIIFEIGQTIIAPVTVAIVSQLFLYLLIDLRKYNSSKTYWGDFTGLLTFSRFAAYIVIIPVILIHLTMLIYVLK